MRFAYADPPYLGCSQALYREHPEAAVYDTLDGHRLLIERLVEEYPDGWAMSLHTPSLQTILPLCPNGVRVGAWTKPFCAFKANVNPAYAWEPVIWRGGRKRTREQPTVRDWLAESITLRRGFTGAKPAAFTRWVLDLLGAEPDDEIHDLFPGSGAVTDAIAGWREAAGMDQTTIGLFADATE